MKITHEIERHTFTAWTDDGRQMGQIAYAPHEKDFSATHTNVSDEFQGHGVARMLLDSLAAYAEKKRARILPVCSYVIDAFEKHPERYQNVLPD